MKKLNTAILFILSVQLLSACSHGYRSNSFEIQQAQQRQAQIQAQQLAKIQAYQQAQRKKQAIRKVSIQNRPIRKASHTSQQSRSNAVDSQQAIRNRIAQMAHSTIGEPYKWGGNNRHQGFDCSGLMSYIHKNALGMKIPRTAAQQRDASRTINYNQLKPGDMLFFKTGKNSNHVGIYVGNREFVHAATGSKKVRKVSMDNPYWHKRFVKFGTFL